MQDYRELHPGMGVAVAERTVVRPKERGRETWGDVADRVALGNTLLEQGTSAIERAALRREIAKGVVLMSGRHLQHGDAGQPEKPLEMFSNCSTAALRFMVKQLLLNGCFRAGTLVKMADGTLKPIEDVRPGDEVVSYDETRKEFVHQKVTKLHRNAPKPMVRVRLASSEEIVCTADHKFLTVEGEWVEAQHLSGREVVRAEA